MPRAPSWATHLEKKGGQPQRPHVMHSHLQCPGPDPGKLHPSFCAWWHSRTHVAPQRGSWGHCGSVPPARNPMQLLMRTSWGMICPRAPIAHVGVGAAGDRQKPGSLDFFGTFSRLGPGCPRQHFRDVLPNWVPWARMTAETGHQRPDMTFRQNDHRAQRFLVKSGKSSPFFDAQT